LEKTVAKRFSYRDEPVEIPISELQKDALKELRFYYHLDDRVKRFPGMVDRIMDVLTFFPDDSKPFEFHVFCPLCGWMSKLIVPSGPDFLVTPRAAFINTVCRILGNHLKRKHKLYESKTAWLAPKVPVTFFKCKKCGYEAMSLLEILSHYVHEHI